jgi:hypothetical protein
MRGVDSLIAKFDGRLAHALPSVPQLLGQVPRQSRFGRRPAIMLLPPSIHYLAVVAFPARHNQMLAQLLASRQSLRDALRCRMGFRNQGASARMRMGRSIGGGVDTLIRLIIYGDR